MHTITNVILAPWTSLHMHTITNVILYVKLDGKDSERVQLPAKAFLSPTLGNTCHTYNFAAR